MGKFSSASEGRKGKRNALSKKCSERILSLDDWLCNSLSTEFALSTKLRDIQRYRQSKW
jgi:hypothetical protein